MRRVGGLAAAVLVAGACGAGSAHALTVPIPVTEGVSRVALAGTDGVVYQQRSSARQRLVYASGSGATTTLADIPNGDCNFFDDVAVSATRVAVLVRHSTQGTSGCFSPSTVDFLAGPPSGPLTPVPASVLPDDGGRACVATNIELDGDRLLTGTTCPYLTVTDLSASPPGPLHALLGSPAPASPTQRIALPPGKSIAASDALALNGPWLAFFDREATRERIGKHQIVLRDLRAGEVLRLDIGDLLADLPTNVGPDLALDADGTLAASVPDYNGVLAPPRILWTAPDAPTRHVVPNTGSRGQIALAGGLLAAARDGGKGVIELRTGADRGTFTYDAALQALDFDGTSVAWPEVSFTNQRAGAVHREPWPHDPGPKPGTAPVVGAPPAAVPAGAVTPAGNRAPTIDLVGLAANLRAAALRTLRAKAADADGRVAAVTFAVVRRSGKRCADLTSGGRLATLPAGSCTPRHELKASGAGAYAARLKRRLPAGSYEVLANARDDDGAVVSVRRRVRVR